jgi:hypothetical protein
MGADHEVRALTARVRRGPSHECPLALAPRACIAGLGECGWGFSTWRLGGAPAPAGARRYVAPSWAAVAEPGRPDAAVFARGRRTDRRDAYGRTLTHAAHRWPSQSASQHRRVPQLR